MRSARSGESEGTRSGWWRRAALESIGAGDLGQIYKGNIPLIGISDLLLSCCGGNLEGSI